MDSLVITGNKDKLEALEIVNNLYDAYDGRPDVAEFVIRVSYFYGKPRSVVISFSGEKEFECGGEKDANERIPVYRD
jgi:hypothetical protein